jgi:hypothetical protein
MFRLAVFNFEFAARYRCRDDKSSGFDAVRNNRVFRRAQIFDAFDFDSRCSGAFIRAPILFKSSAKSSISGSQAAFVNCRFSLSLKPPPSLRFPFP